VNENPFFVFFGRDNDIFVYRLSAKNKSDAEKRLNDFIDEKNKQLSRYGLRLMCVLEPHEIMTLESFGKELDNKENEDIVKDIIT